MKREKEGVKPHLCEEKGEEDSCVIYKSSSVTVLRKSIPLIPSPKDINKGGKAYPKAKESVFVIKKKPSSPNHSSRLKNEYEVLSSYFSRKTKTIRRALECETDDKNRVQSIHLEYVKGISIKEWIKTNPLRKEKRNSSSWKNTMMDRVCLAAGIAGALSDVHDAGILHKDVVPSSFIVDNRSKHKKVQGGITIRSWPVTIISFGHARHQKVTKRNDFGDCVNDDLQSLGNVFSQLFSFDSENKKEKKSILLEDLPQPIKTLLSNLNKGDLLVEDSFGTAREVQQDLIQMIEDPNIFLFEPNEKSFKHNELNFTKNKLYGRSNEIQILQELCHRISKKNIRKSSNTIGDDDDDSTDDEASSNNNDSDFEHNSSNRRYVVNRNAEIVFVAGLSGVGKSELVRHACHTKISSEMNGYYIHGKYDQLRRAQPYSALTLAFTDLCNKILQQEQKVIDNMSQKIQMAVGALGNVITDVIPSLEKIIGKQPDISTVNMSGAELQNRFNFVFRMFIRAISNPSHPIVLVLDDLQWADAASLNLLNILLNDTSHHTSMMFVCCYRDNEVDNTHPLSRIIRGLNDRPTNTNSGEKRSASSQTKNEITYIKLEHLTDDAVNNLVSDTLRMSRRMTRPLSHMVHRKTEGNAFFVIQFLKSIRDDSILSYSRDMHRWQWDLNELRWQNIPENVVDLLAAKIRKLSSRTQEVLKVAAAIGSYFDEGEVKLVIDGREEAKPEFTATRNTCNICCEAELEILLSEGLILKLCSSGYKFAHDRIQQAAYGLVNKEEHTPLHLKIGRLKFELLMKEHGEVMREGSDGGGTDSINAGHTQKLLFATAHQLNRGSALITDQRERIEVAKLNLRAGEMAMNSSAFGPASVYLKAGIGMLGVSKSKKGDDKYRWENHYNLMLNLYSNLAESEYCNGSFNEVNHIVDIVLKNAKTIEDKISSYTVLINSTSVQDLHREAFTIGLEVLAQLGEYFPTKKVTMLAVVMDLMKTKLMLRGKTDAQLLSLPFMTSKRKYMVMTVLSRMYSCAIPGAHEYLPLIINRLVQISLTHGVCDISPFGFTLFGSMVCGVLGEMSNGTRYGELGLKLSERFNTAQKFHSRLVGVLINSIWVWSKRSHELIEPCTNVYHMGMDHGDNEYAMYGVWNLMLNSIFCGKHLDGVADDIRNYAQLMVELGQKSPLTIFVPIWQFVLNLTGASANPTVLTGEAMDQEVMLKGPNAMSACDTAIFVLILAYLFHDYNLAAEMSKRSKHASKIHPGMPTVWLRVFYDGLTSLAMARAQTKAGKQKKWLKRANKSILQVKKWSKHSAKIFLNKYKLMRAEEAAILKGDKKMSEVVKAYDDAICAAATSGYLHDEALANERAGLYLLDIVGDQSVGSRYLDRANELYVKWGAHAKVNP